MYHIQDIFFFIGRQNEERVRRVQEARKENEQKAMEAKEKQERDRREREERQKEEQKRRKQVLLAKKRAEEAARLQKLKEQVRLQVVVDPSVNGW